MDNFERPQTTASVTTPAPKKTNTTKLISLIILALVLLGLIGYATYAFLTINQKNDKVASQDKVISSLQTDNKKLMAENKKMTDQTNATTKVADSPAMNMTDSNFVALAPDNGYMSSTGKTTFEWTPHKDATKYVVEIKSLGQATYPSVYVTDQTYTVTPADATATKLSLTKTLASGDYVWRVTALHTVTGSDMVMQSTADRNYQIR